MRDEHVTKIDQSESDWKAHPSPNIHKGRACFGSFPPIFCLAKSQVPKIMPGTDRYLVYIELNLSLHLESGSHDLQKD